MPTARSARPLSSLKAAMSIRPRGCLGVEGIFVSLVRLNLVLFFFTIHEIQPDPLWDFGRRIVAWIRSERTKTPTKRARSLPRRRSGQAGVNKTHARKNRPAPVRMTRPGAPASESKSLGRETRILREIRGARKNEERTKNGSEDPPLHKYRNKRQSGENGSLTVRRTGIRDDYIDGWQAEEGGLKSCLYTMQRNGANRSDRARY